MTRFRVLVPIACVTEDTYSSVSSNSALVCRFCDTPRAVAGDFIFDYEKLGKCLLQTTQYQPFGIKDSRVLLGLLTPEPTSHHT
jgi:hypothetical protein